MSETSLLTPADKLIKANIEERKNKKAIFYNSRQKQKIRKTIRLDKDIFDIITRRVNISKKSRGTIVNEVLKKVLQID